VKSTQQKEQQLLILIGGISFLRDKEKVRINYHLGGFPPAADTFNLKYFF